MNNVGFIIKFGGSLLFEETTLNIDQNKIQELVDITFKFRNIYGLVCGGGKVARKYIQAGRVLGFDEVTLDSLGIMISRINAQLLIYCLGKSTYPEPIINTKQAQDARTRNQMFVAGGFVPKQSTTTVAMQLCEALQCDLIILTDVNGIYDKDPKTHRDAKKYGRITYNELEQILVSRSGQEQTAGRYQIFDLLALSILKRSRIKVRIIDGTELQNLESLLTGNFYTATIGTIITQ